MERRGFLKSLMALPLIPVVVKEGNPVEVIEQELYPPLDTPIEDLSVLQCSGTIPYIAST